MQYFNDEIVARLKSLPKETRDRVFDGLVKMVAERPKGVNYETSDRGNLNNDGILNTDNGGFSPSFNN